MRRSILRARLLVVCLWASVCLVASACDGGGHDGPDGDQDEDPDLDFNPFPTDGDEQPRPDTQPDPEGDPVWDFRFGETVTTLSDWLVVDAISAPEGASDWRVLTTGLVQTADMEATRSPSPDPANSHFVSTDLRYARREIIPNFVELTLSPGELAGGFGISLEDGLSEVIVCLNEDACGSRLVRWNQSGVVLGVSPVPSYSDRETLTLRVSVSKGYGMVSLDGDLLLTVPVTPLVENRVGLLLYLQDQSVIHRLRVWGEPSPEFARERLSAQVVGERGFGASEAEGFWPENTLVSLRQGLAAGADAVLLEIRTTSDGVPVLLHDATLDRTTDCTGEVSALTAAELAQCAVRDAPGETVRVPTLDEVLTSLSRATLWIRLFDNGDEVVNRAVVRAVVDLLTARAATERVYLVSENIENLRFARVLYRGVRVFWEVPFAGDTVLQTAAESVFDGVLVPEDLLTPTDISTGRTLGVKIAVSGVNTLTRVKAALEAGVDVLVTQRPDRVAGYGWRR